jgi:hypothetical protein
MKKETRKHTRQTERKRIRRCYESPRLLDEQVFDRQVLFACAMSENPECDFGPLQSG